MMNRFIKSNKIKSIVLFFWLLGCLDTLNAQVIDINPNVQWKYVRSQQLELKNKSTYQYEFQLKGGMITSLALLLMSRVSKPMLRYLTFK